MIDSFIGTKIDQSQSFTSDGKRIPITSVWAEPMVIIRIKSKEENGYNAIQVGIGNRRIITLTKPELGSLKKAGLDKNPPRFLREIKISEKLIIDKDKYKPGTIIKTTDVFKEGDTILVTSVSKGKGFQGVVKRHNFRGGPRTHGQSDRERAPGAIGQTTTPGRVYKGKRMAGRMGNQQVTIKNLKVIKIDEKNNLLMIKGLIPGGRRGCVVIKKQDN